MKPLLAFPELSANEARQLPFECQHGLTERGLQIFADASEILAQIEERVLWRAIVSFEALGQLAGAELLKSSWDTQRILRNEIALHVAQIVLHSLSPIHVAVQALVLEQKVADRHLRQAPGGSQSPVCRPNCFF